MRLLTLIVALLLALIQYPLWLGKGGWLRTWELERQIGIQRQTNQELSTRNAALDAEVRDLKSGTDAIEERARFELGMLKQGEAFVQIVEGNGSVPGSAPSPMPSAAPGAVPRSPASGGVPGHASRPARAPSPAAPRAGH